MNTLTVELHRALAFVESANRGGHSPSIADLDAWCRHYRLRDDDYLLQTLASRTAIASWAASRREPIPNHLLNLGWLTRGQDGGLSLTKLGKALLKDAATGQTDYETVVLGADNPLAYALLVGELARMGEGMIVDPYLDVESLNAILQHTQFKRLLIGRKMRKEQFAALITFWGGLHGSAQLRVASDLHDRVILTSTADVWTLGSSLNTVARGKTTTILTPIPGRGAEALRDEYENKWEKATAVEDLSSTALGREVRR